jgi:hypothetical protein
MQLGSSIFFAWQSITRHRLRSFLALLGVAAGALALISTVSVEQSWQRTVEEAFRGLNLNAVEVRIAGNVQAAKLKRKDLIDEDAVAIRECCPAVEKLTVYSLDSADIHAGRERAADLQLAYLIDDQYSERDRPFGRQPAHSGCCLRRVRVDGAHREPVSRARGETPRCLLRE